MGESSASRIFSTFRSVFFRHGFCNDHAVSRLNFPSYRLLRQIINSCIIRACHLIFCLKQDEMTKIDNHSKEYESKKIDNPEHFSILLSSYHSKFRFGKSFLPSSLRLLSSFRLFLSLLIDHVLRILLFPFSASFLFAIFSTHLLPPTPFPVVLRFPRLPPFLPHLPYPG